MTCPACGRELTEKKIEDIFVDVCDQGCGGIWFDRFELQKMDEPHEGAGTELLDTPRHEGIHVDHEDDRWCPRCDDRKLFRHFYSVKRQVEVDDCPQCGGIWLDLGELARIRDQFATEGERREAAEAYFEDVFGEDLEKMRLSSKEAEERARRIAQAFRLICPSYYIPGKQPWGAF